jgi:uncharacterized protein (TIGR02246 family)
MIMCAKANRNMMIPILVCLMAIAQPCIGADSDRENDVREIEALSLAWVDAEGRKDLAGSLEPVWEDAMWLPPDAGPVHGKEAIRALYEEFFAAIPYTTMSVNLGKVIVSSSGDLATSWAEFSASGEGPDGSFTIPMKAVMVWEKRGGKWGVSINMYNSNAPAVQN